MSRLAAVDVGTNSVLLLVAERGLDGVVRPVREEADITRLGRGVDRTGLLSDEGMEATLEVLARYAALARADGARALVVIATSAARDARNGAEFLDRARERAGATVEILSGSEEARLSYLAVARDFGAEAGAPGLLAIDVGGGSTELVHGSGDTVLFRVSLDIGSVRLTERCVRSDPPAPREQEAVRAAVRAALARLPTFPRGARAVGVAGTVTSLFAIAQAIEPYDAGRVHGGWLSMADIARVRAQLCALPLPERKLLPGMQPKRADVLPAGALLFETVLSHLDLPGAHVSDRGLRWGVLLDRWETLA
ncbi:MAG TPA: Ppx/GppA phosphatase family protein [Myxococcaceae bacterium]|nr:Ppx/GppA phosphatase family protein [Myxococcaceae bacterium]